MADDLEFRSRFLRESQQEQRLLSISPFIIPVCAAGEAEGLLYIATRFVAGGDLAGMLRRNRGQLSHLSLCLSDHRRRWHLR